ncbi:hypothetical protein AK812_SmicGene48465, partial [Symbiodinium microadriaticum]
PGRRPSEGLQLEAEPGLPAGLGHLAARGFLRIV